MSKMYVLMRNDDTVPQCSVCSTDFTKVGRKR